MNDAIESRQSFNCTVEQLWDALTDKDKMKIWYFPQLTGFEPIVGYIFQFINDGSPFQKEWKVIRVEPLQTLSHSWTYIGYPGYSEVTFHLSEARIKTELHLIHTGVSSFPSDPHFARRRFEEGWDRIIRTNLKNFIEQHYQIN